MCLDIPGISRSSPVVWNNMSDSTVWVFPMKQNAGASMTKPPDLPFQMIQARPGVQLQSLSSGRDPDRQNPPQRSKISSAELIGKGCMLYYRLLKSQYLQIIGTSRLPILSIHGSLNYAKTMMNLLKDNSWIVSLVWLTSPKRSARFNQSKGLCQSDQPKNQLKKRF